MRVRAVRRGAMPLIVTLLLAAGCATSSDPASDDAVAEDDGAEPDDTTPNDQDDQDEQISPDDPDHPAGLAAGDIGVYLSVTTDSDRSVFGDVGTGPIVLESTRQAVVLLDLSSPSAGIVDSTSSTSYARSHLRPHTFEGRLVIVDELDGDGFYYQQYDARTGRPSGVEGKVGGADSYTFTGSSIFDVRVVERLGAPNELLLRQTDLDTGTSTDLGDFVLEGGDLLGWDGQLYHVTWARDDDPIRLHHIPLGAIDRPEFMVEGAITRDLGEVGYSWALPTVSAGSVHWLEAVDLGGSARINVWSYDLVANDGEFRNPATIEVPITGLMSMPNWDVDGTVVAAHLWTDDDEHQLLVHDWTTGVTELHPLDVAPFELAVLAG